VCFDVVVVFVCWIVCVCLCLFVLEVGFGGGWW
jgi:hypothetical protein